MCLSVAWQSKFSISWNIANFATFLEVTWFATKCWAYDQGWAVCLKYIMISPKLCLADILCLLRFLLHHPDCCRVMYYYSTFLFHYYYYVTRNAVGWRIAILRFFFTIIITSPGTQSGDVLLFYVSFSLLLLLLFLLLLLLFFHTFLSARFLGDALIKLYETLQEYHMPCEAVLWRVDFFQNGCRCHGNDQNAKNWKTQKRS
jgi:hypothetical protein